MDDLKRVGLIFDAKGVSDFKSALKSINTELNQNRSEFKLVKTQWDENTKASKKLADTQSYLSKQYEESRDKVTLLSAELDNMKNAENRNETAIQKKQAALNNAKASMIRYKQGLDDVNEKIKLGTADLEEYVKKIQDIGNKTTTIGSKLTKNVTAPIVATGTAAALAWNEIDNAYDNIIVGTGATGETLQGLQDEFDRTFTMIPDSAENVSIAIADLNTRFGFTGLELSGASVQFLKFAKINNTDVSSAIALVSRAMGDAGVEANEYSSVLDALTAASQGSGISIDRLAENVTKYGAPMRALGYTMQESIALFSQWEKAGVNTEIAFSGMKKAITNFAKEGKNAKEEFKKVLTEIERCPDISSATTKAIEVFGAKAGPDLADAIQGGKFSIEEFTKVVEDSGGIVKTTYEQILDPQDKLKLSLNNLKLVGKDFFDIILDKLTPVFEYILDEIEQLTMYFLNMPDSMQNIILMITGIVAAIGPMTFAIGKVITFTGGCIEKFIQLKAGLFGATGAFAKIGTMITAINPTIIAVTALIAAVIAAVVYLWNTNEEFRTSVQNIIANIISILTTLWESVVSPILNSIKDLLLVVWHDGIEPLMDAFTMFVQVVISLMSQLISALTPVVNYFIKSFGPSITRIINSVKDILKNLIQFISNVFTGNWKAAWRNVVNIFGSIFRGLIGFAKGPINSIIGFLNVMIGAIESAINGVISMLNSINISIPKWVPKFGGKSFGFNLDYVGWGRIPMLADGGTLLNGMAMVAEAGPELLLQQGNSTKVLPLSKESKNHTEIIDYDRLTLALIKALKTLKIVLDKEEVGEFVDERLLEAM